jgi:hypothetical protein
VSDIEDNMSKQLKGMTKVLVGAPDNELDNSMKTNIQSWSDPVTPIQILEVLDHCIHGSLASGFVVHLLQIMYDISCTFNKTTHEEVLKSAVWRNL